MLSNEGIQTMPQDSAATNAHGGRIRRRVNDLVVAEMFLIQATLESATAIGDGVSELGRQMSPGKDESGESVQEILQRIKSEALEPYTSRYKYFRQLVSSSES